MSSPKYIYWRLSFLHFALFMSLNYANDYLAAYNIYLWCPAPLVILGAFFLEGVFGSVTLICYGLLLSTLAPSYYNSSIILSLIMIVYCMLLWIKPHIEHTHSRSIWGLLCCIQIILFCILAYAFKSEVTALSYYLRCFQDCILSLAIIPILMHILCYGYIKIGHSHCENKQQLLREFLFW